MSQYKSVKIPGLLLICLVFFTALLFPQGIIIDHTCTDITQIPDTWITQVKSTLKIHYAHTSHGEQITEGLERLSNANSKYNYYPDNCTVPQTTQYLSLMDGQYFDYYCETYVTPDLYWEGSYGLNITRSVLNSFDVNVSLWAWCYQLDYYSQGQAQDYLDAMTQLESEFPNVTFIYMTGNAQSEEQNRYDRNNQIRDYCRNNNKVLFDFADLDCWYNGQQHTENGIPMEHPQYHGDQGGHTTYESCENKARAFWWLLARIAGWDGTGGGGNGPDLPPFGTFETPLKGSTVRSSIPVTGWALDDIGVDSVKIYRETGTDLAYIGDALLIEGARPDIETAYPDYPNNSRAGWGYMMLTNFLPNGGNGTFTLHAIATDSSNQSVTLGTKTITCDNANAVKPFGAIDTPIPGGTASGTNFRNVGWALTPMPNIIPETGSTINVYVDGVDLGNPVYDVYRPDIAALFPGYANSYGAAAYFYFDTTAYTNGVHTIAWTAEDNAGNSDGIGSRYFTIQNPGTSRESPAGHLYEEAWSREQGAGGMGHGAWRKEHGAWGMEHGGESRGAVGIVKGYKKNVEPEKMVPDENGIIHIKIKELERLEIHFFDSRPNISPLPIGSTLDMKRGIFYWQPGPGFLGTFELVKKKIMITIVPR